MKNTLKIILTIAIGAAISFLPSCSVGDFNEANYYYTAFGTIDNSSRTPFIDADGGYRLTITELSEQTSAEEIAEKSGRVAVNYTILSNTDGGYNVRLNFFYNLHIEDIKVLSALSTEEKDALKEDPVVIADASISGGYINIIAGFTYDINKVDTFVHEIDLVYDDQTAYKDDDVHCTLYHEGDGSTSETGKIGYKWISFKLTDDLVEKLRQTYVSIKSNWYANNGGNVSVEARFNVSPFAGVLSSSNNGNAVRESIVPFRID